MVKSKMVKLPEVVWFQEGPGVRNTQYTTNGVKLLNVANLVDGVVDLSTSDRFISEEEAYGKYKHFLCDEGDFIVASSGIQVSYIDKKMGFIDKNHLPLCMNTSTIRFRSLDNKILNIRFFMYFIKSNLFKHQLERHITGSAQLNYGPSHLKKMELSLPELSIQNKIVEKLDSMQKIIDIRRKEIQNLDNLVKSRFVEMFGEMDSLNSIDKQTLGDVCDVRDGTHDSPKYYSEGYPLVTSKNVTSGEIDFSSCNLISIEDFNKINARSKVDIGDILMPMIGTVGKPVIVNTNKEFAIKNVALIKFRENSCVTNVFIKALLESNYFDRAVLSKIRGGTQKFISLGDVRKLELMVPSLAMQYNFSEFVKQVDKSKFAILTNIFYLDKIYIYGKL